MSLDHPADTPTTEPMMFVVEVRGFGHDATTMVEAESPGDAVKAACEKYGVAVRVVGEFAARCGQAQPDRLIAVRGAPGTR